MSTTSVSMAAWALGWLVASAAVCAEGGAWRKPIWTVSPELLVVPCRAPLTCSSVRAAWFTSR